MNSVIHIGDKVLFLHEGHKEWEGSNQEILDTENKQLYDFIFASDFLKKLKES
jgi:phospholipid/cholesterol/gamma-HCH transport system ATP-binding protein